MGFWATLGLAIRLAPQLLELIKLILDVLEETTEVIEKQRKLSQMTKAIQHAKATKDTSKLEDLFRGPKPPPAG
jgi:hypothetical protein